MKANFVKEIEGLLDEVPPAHWQDPGACGLLYEFVPWHTMSSLTIQTQEDDVRDIGGWKYYFSAESDGWILQEEFEAFRHGKDWLTYHRLLIEAAEALLEIDFSRFGYPELVEGHRLYVPFRLQVYHSDGVYQFNYCEHVLARRAEGS